VTTHAQKPDLVFRRNGRVHFKSAEASVQSTTGSRGVRISGSNAGYTMFRGSVKGTGYPLHSPISTFTSPPVRHSVPSHFNWSLQLHLILPSEVEGGESSPWRFTSRKRTRYTIKQSSELQFIAGDKFTVLCLLHLIGQNV